MKKPLKSVVINGQRISLAPFPALASIITNKPIPRAKPLTEAQKRELLPPITPDPLAGSFDLKSQTPEEFFRTQTGQALLQS